MRVAVVLVTALSLAACGESTDQTPVRINRVELPKSYRFEPPVIEVDAGTTVTWTNRDDFPHNVHLLDASDRTESLPIGGSASIPFDETGTVNYECSLHPQQMRGTVIVR